MKKAYALATILILLGVLMFGTAALVTISVLEQKISRSEVEGTVAYYIAEAGIQDAVWRLNNNSTYSTALRAGTLNVTYNATVSTNQTYAVTMVNSSQGAGYAQIDVTSTWNNGTFTAQRHVRAAAFQGVDAATGNNAFFGGGAVSVTNGSSAINIIGGDFYSRGNMTVNNATLNASGQNVEAVGTYSANGGSTVTGTVHGSNLPPAPADISTPGYDFTQYSSLVTGKCTSSKYTTVTQLRCTPAEFQALISTSSFTFNNTVVYVDSALTMNSWAKNKTITFNGLLVVNGNLSVTNAATGLVVNFNDPGTGKSGLIVKSNITNAVGTWNVNGVYYASGSMTFNNSQSITINGAMVAGGAVAMNTGLAMSLTYNETRAAAILGGTPSAVQVLHWEEEY